MGGGGAGGETVGCGGTVGDVVEGMVVVRVEEVEGSYSPH